jgi:Tfp pilus assembly PilM family ATPase
MEKQGLKLDFRFADDMDAVELVQFVNEAHDEEVTEGSSMAFRKAGQRVTVEEVSSGLLSFLKTSTNRLQSSD